MIKRSIAEGDEGAFPDPSEPLARRRASGAGRLAARSCLAGLGGPPDAALPRAPGGFPIWPPGFVGSIAHDEKKAVAVAARTKDILALGVDVEPAAPLPPDVAEIALFGAERREVADDPARSRAIFAAKEAVYKAINPLDGSPLEYEDIAVDLDRLQARLRDGRSLRLDMSRGERFILAAWIAAR